MNEQLHMIIIMTFIYNFNLLKLIKYSELPCICKFRNRPCINRISLFLIGCYSSIVIDQLVDKIAWRCIVCIRVNVNDTYSRWPTTFAMRAKQKLSKADVETSHLRARFKANSISRNLCVVISSSDI